MKRIILFSILFYTTFNFAKGQSSELSIVHFKNNSAYIEGNGNYWITAQSNISLQAGLRKAIKWTKLNLEHQEEFSKEIVRIRITDKQTFEFYRKYIDGFSNEGKLVFNGFNDGTFSLSLLRSSAFGESTIFTLIRVEEISSLIAILQGRKINNGIDKIFN